MYQYVWREFCMGTGILYKYKYYNRGDVAMPFKTTKL